MIIAIKEKDAVVIAYSNDGSCDALTDLDRIDEENVAIRFSETGATFAAAVENRQAEILLYDDEFLKMEVTAKNIVREMIPYIKNKCDGKGMLYRKKDKWDNALVICRDGRLYDVDRTLRFYEADDYVCHGYVADTFESVLDLTAGLPAKERILKAVRFFCKLHKENLFPFVITDTKTKKFEYIYEGENK